MTPSVCHGSIPTNLMTFRVFHLFLAHPTEVPLAIALSVPSFSEELPQWHEQGQGFAFLIVARDTLLIFGHDLWAVL